MSKISFSHGGPEYDRRYPEGIPTSIVITTAAGERFDSGLVMFPSGHARNATADLKAILENKFRRLGALSTKNLEQLLAALAGLRNKTAAEVETMYGGLELDFHPEYAGKI